MWNLREAIAEAALLHHDPSSSVEASRMSLITACVDEALAHVGFAGTEWLVDPFDNAMFRIAGLSGDQAEALLVFTEMLMETPEAWILSDEDSQEGYPSRH